MMRMSTMAAGKSSPAPEEEKPAAASWEVRPGGMLVQKRVDGDDTTAAAPPVPNIRVRVKHGDVYHEIYIGAQSSFGELKKMVSERTGMHPLDQKVVYKKRERGSGAFLDTSGVKDGSKVVVMEDPAAQARRCLEMRRSAKTEKATRSVSEIGVEVDKLASKVSEFSSMVARGDKVVPENDLTSLIEMLMNQLVKLDGIVVADDGDVKAQRRMQVRRVQRLVEALDVLKIRKAVSPPPPLVASKRVESPEDRRVPVAEEGNTAAEQEGRRGQQQQQQQQHQQPRQGAAPAPVVVTTKWEVFDSLFSPTSSAAATAPAKFGSAAAAAPTKLGSAAATATAAGRLDWELF